MCSLQRDSVDLGLSYQRLSQKRASVLPLLFRGPRGGRVGTRGATVTVGVQGLNSLQLSDAVKRLL